MPGIHHVTAIGGPAVRNLDFYTRVLGLRLVKKTVNFDDPGTWHLYYGDEAGRPGTILTFFPWQHAAKGRIGPGETGETAFRVPLGAIGFWMHRFLEKGVQHGAPEKRFGDTVVTFKDPDGMPLALIGSAESAGDAAWATADIPAEHAIGGLHAPTLLLRDAAATASVLTDVLGFAPAGEEDGRARFRAGEGAGGLIDLKSVGDFPPGRLGAGSVHHIAFRARDDSEQAAMVTRLAENHGLHTTEQKDRNYFRSVYFREPGGLIFEIATDAPGFAVDEPQDGLGGSLKLPPFLEARRAEIEAVLPELD
jgi:glyoxalase family protein